MDKNVKKKVGLSVISVLTVLFLGSNLEVSTSIEGVHTIGEYFNTFQMTDVVYLVLYYILFSKIIDIKDKRAKICCSILAIIFSFSEVVGYSVSRYCDLSCIMDSKSGLIKALLKFIGYVITFYSVLLLIFVKGFPKLKSLRNKDFKLFTSNKKSFFAVALIIFLCYVPYFLSQYPGIVSTDSIAEISTSLFSLKSMVNHHPVFHIFIISIFMNIGKAVNNYNLGIALYSIFQMAFTACTFSFTLYYMTKKNVNFYIRLLCLAFFALYPPFANFAITMWKDVPFGLSVLLYTINMIELATNKEYLNNIRNKVLLVLTSLLVILFRNNGIYVVLLSIPFMIFFTKNSRKTTTIISVLLVALYVIWKGPIFSLLNIQDGPIREALSVPVQQIARTVKYRANELTEEEKGEINKYLPVDRIGDLYYPLISDNVKDTLNNDAVKENKVQFIKIWLKLFIKYPREYVEAFLSGSYGYWYPEAKNWVIWEFDEDSYELGRQALQVDIKKDSIIGTTGWKNMIHEINYSPMTLISGIFSIGLAFFATVTMLMYVIYRKEYKLILAYVPIIFLWVTTIASPVWCEYRYIYSIFTCAPILIVSITQFIEKNENKINS